MSDQPQTIIIVPYRDRAAQLTAFKILISHMLDHEKRSYEILYVHQQDSRNFNRGAMKNIGFIYVKETYPNSYQNITLVFHDIDTIPSRADVFDYDTVPNVVKHFYGYKYALGGIFAIKAGDFEKINGFPNFWAWGFEDNLLKDRWTKANGRIDYSQFRDVFHPDVLCLFHGFDRLRHQRDVETYNKLRRLDNDKCGITTVRNVKYNKVSLSETMSMINVTAFDTVRPEERHKIHKDNMINVAKLHARRRRRRNTVFKLW